jgi:lipid II:glycine glycyltransferase (peptidoglycan interpeptide bridge formation enzyme)
MLPGLVVSLTIHVDCLNKDLLNIVVESYFSFIKQDWVAQVSIKPQV